MREGTAMAPPPEVEFRPFGKWAPWIVPLFVFANVVMFIVTMFVNDCPRKSFSCFGKFLGRFAFQPLKENPLLGPSSITLEEMGALTVSKVVGQREIWRLLTSIWLHAGVVHLLANMLSLVFIGIRLEKEFGFVKIGFLYVISGFGANILSTLFLESTISVGASGALFGLLGAMLSELLTNWTIYANKVAALLTLIVIIIINLSVGILPHVDNFAHLGGFFSGFLLGFILLLRPQFGWVMQKHAPPGYVPRATKPKHKTYQYVLWCASAVILFAGMTVGLVMIFRGVDGNKYCSWCHYLTCVPLTKNSCQSKQFSCESTQMGNEWNLTCVDNGRNHVYKLTEGDPSQLQQLCSQLCS